MQAVEKNTRLEPDAISRGGPEVRQLMQLWDRLMLEDGLLKRRYESTSSQGSWMQLVVPHVLWEEIIKELHAIPLDSHLGVDKTMEKVQERFYWPGMQQNVAQ